MPSFASIEKMINGHLFCFLNDYFSQENNAHFVNFGSTNRFPGVEMNFFEETK